MSGKWPASSQGNKGEGKFKAGGLKAFHIGHLFTIGLINLLLIFLRLLAVQYSKAH